MIKCNTELRDFFSNLSFIVVRVGVFFILSAYMFGPVAAGVIRWTSYWERVSMARIKCSEHVFWLWEQTKDGVNYRHCKICNFRQYESDLEYIAPVSTRGVHK